jgi:hypothetical protein
MRVFRNGEEVELEKQSFGILNKTTGATSSPKGNGARNAT